LPFAKSLYKLDDKINSRRVENKFINQEIIFIINQNQNGEYEARTLEHSIFTIAETKEELINQIQDAIAIPEKIDLEYFMT
jgi:hypothetical protein